MTSKCVCTLTHTQLKNRRERRNPSLTTKLLSQLSVADGFPERPEEAQSALNSGKDGTTSSDVPSPSCTRGEEGTVYVMSKKDSMTAVSQSLALSTKRQEAA